MTIDNAIDPRLCWAAIAEFPKLDWDGWHYYNDQDAKKYGQKENVELPKVFDKCIDMMIKRCSTIVGSNCFPDLSLYGAGVHRIETEGYLRRHLDASLHARTGWKREWSVILYLNPSWEATDGGRFGMTSSLDENCDASQTKWTEPVFNRMTIFQTHEKNRHQVEQYRGVHPRLSLALFYFSLDEPRQPLRHKAQFDPV
tara:strand:+ start:498 stop:1094 length:597 start_codon:yes stop_codon:yes gene_type:complete